MAQTQTEVREDTADAGIEVDGLTMAFGPKLVQRDLSFRIRPGEIFAIMGGSGCGKSTLLKHMIGLIRPAEGTVRYGGEDYWAAGEARRAEIGRRFGILFQSGALWSSLTVAENVAMPLEMFTRLPPARIAELVRLKLALVGLAGAGDQYSSQISGGMKKRAGLARALALDPEILFLDEPSAGLDPVTSRRLDSLILSLRDALGITVVIVSHELESIFSIADNSLFLDVASKTAVAHGKPTRLREECSHPAVQAFLRRQDPEERAPDGSGRYS